MFSLFFCSFRAEKRKVTNIDILVDKIIPYPADHSHRNGFNNEPIIDGLSSEEKIQVENALLNKLNEHPQDLLIVEALAYMKSEKSLKRLHGLLEEAKRVQAKIIIASCIYEISKEDRMREIVYEGAKTITEKYSLIGMLYYMAKMRDTRINELIVEHSKSADYLISYNAKRYLGLFNKVL